MCRKEVSMRSFFRRFRRVDHGVDNKAIWGVLPIVVIVGVVLSLGHCYGDTWEARGGLFPRPQGAEQAPPSAL